MIRIPPRTRALLTRALRLALAGLALAHVLVFLHLAARRLRYPFDLEWMEGGMLLHALRLLEGKPLYGPPTLEFVPFLYTPLYPALLAVLGKLAGLSYALGRALSLASLGGALYLGYRAARRAGADSVVAAAAMAAVLAAFPFVGGWYDIVRNDELFLALGMAGLCVAIRFPTVRGALAAAALLCASYFAKQTGEALLLTALVVFLVLSWRAALVYAAAAAMLWGGTVLALDRATHGWFWAWCAQAHARHAFYAKRAFLETPWILLKQAPAIWLCGVGLLVWKAVRRELDRKALAWTIVGGAGAALACVAFGTQWAFTNAFIPGVFFPLVALAVLSACDERTRLLAATALVIQLATHFYDPRPLIPLPDDQAAGYRLLARIAAAPGDVFIPYHPYYPVMVGKPAYLHRMGVMDAPSAGFGRPRGLDEALADGAFALVIQDYKVRWEEWPTLLTHYRLTERLSPTETPRTLSGADTAPLFVLTPIPPDLPR